MRTILVLAVALLAACSSESAAPTSPDATNKKTLGAGGDGGQSDTTSTPTYAGPVRLAGHAFVVAHVAPTAGSRDTLSSTPLAGAELTLYHNVLVNGVGQSVYVGQVTTGSDGAYEFAGIPGGYYLLRGAYAGSSTLSYVAANAAEVTVDVRFWQRS
jgi:hypothetical protein